MVKKIENKIRKTQNKPLVVIILLLLVINLFAIVVLLFLGNKNEGINKNVAGEEISKDVIRLASLGYTNDAYGNTEDSFIDEYGTYTEEAEDTETLYLGRGKRISRDREDKKPDKDKDGIEDSKDNCPNIANPNQADADNDGIGDACETPVEPDSDNDGIKDSVDNCPLIYNPNQADADNDGIGDACETPTKKVKVFFEPSVVSQNEGDSFEMTIKIDTEEEVYATEFRILFNPQIIEVTSVTEGDFLKKDGAETNVFKDTIDNNLGQVHFIDSRISTPIGVSGQGVIATLKIKALAVGSTDLTFQDVKIADVNVLLEAESTNGKVNVN